MATAHKLLPSVVIIILPKVAVTARHPFINIGIPFKVL